MVYCKLDRPGWGGFDTFVLMASLWPPGLQLAHDILIRTITMLVSFHQASIVWCGCTTGVRLCGGAPAACALILASLTEWKCTPRSCHHRGLGPAFGKGGTTVVWKCSSVFLCLAHALHQWVLSGMMWNKQIIRMGWHLLKNHLLWLQTLFWHKTLSVNLIVFTSAMIRCGGDTRFPGIGVPVESCLERNPVPFHVFPAFSPQHCVAAVCLAKPVLGNKSSVDRVMASYTWAHERECFQHSVLHRASVWTTRTMRSLYSWLFILFGQKAGGRGRTGARIRTAFDPLQAGRLETCGREALVRCAAWRGTRKWHCVSEASGSLSEIIASVLERSLFQVKNRRLKYDGKLVINKLVNTKEN